MKIVAKLLFGCFGLPFKQLSKFQIFHRITLTTGET